MNKLLSVMLCVIALTGCGEDLEFKCVTDMGNGVTITLDSYIKDDVLATKMTSTNGSPGVDVSVDIVSTLTKGDVTLYATSKRGVIEYHKNSDMVYVGDLDDRGRNRLTCSNEG